MSRLALLLASIALASAALAAESLGTISGVVLSAATRAPLAASAVTLANADGAPLRTVTADRRGHYVFEQVPPGYYLVKAARPNFATGRWGQKTWNGVGRVIALAPGAGFNADIWLHRLGVITGAVVDENGEGIPNFTANALTAAPNVISGRVSSAGVTDDRGVFRIVGLQPGRYYVCTAPRQLEDGAGLLPTCYPGQLTLAESRAVTVEADRETSDLLIQPVAGRLVHLAGTLVGVARQAGVEATVRLFRDEERRDVTADALGRFAFPDLAPGRYTLVAEAQTPQAKLAAYQALDVYDDREGLAVNLAPAPDVRVRLADDKGADLNDPQVVIYLSRIENGARTPPVRVEPPNPRASAPGSYFGGGLMPGLWRFFVIGPESTAVESITVDGKDALPGFVLMPGRTASATIRLIRDAGKVHGRVTGSDGRPAAGVSVLCYPLAAANRYRLGGYRSLKTSLQGEYRFNGLPEGDYLVFASEVEDLRPDDELEELKARVSPVHVARSADLTHDLRILE